jgi:hypothetical protein
MLFLTRLFKKMHVEAHIVNEPVPNFEIKKAKHNETQGMFYRID